jgi:hypothetical protein
MVSLQDNEVLNQLAHLESMPGESSLQAADPALFHAQQFGRSLESLKYFLDIDTIIKGNREEKNQKNLLHSLLREHEGIIASLRRTFDSIRLKLDHEHLASFIGNLIQQHEKTILTLNRFMAMTS